MHILLLCQGEPEARELFKRTIRARYGGSPPTIESLQIDFSGRAPVKLGPVRTAISTSSRAFFIFPTQARWDFTAKPAGLPIERGSEAFDGARYYRVRRNSDISQVDEAQLLQSIRRRLWIMAALLLTPLSEDYIRLTLQAPQQLLAEDTRAGDVIHLRMRPDDSLESLSARCLNPDTQREQLFEMLLSEEQEPVDGLMLPKKITIRWDGEDFYTATPTRVMLNPQLPPEIFTLKLTPKGD